MMLITGASRGLGRALAEHFSAAGHDVLGISRSAFRADFESREADVSDAQALKRLSGELLSEGRQVSVLINAAGVASMNLALMTPSTSAERIIRTNLLGTIFACQQIAPHMVRQRRGAIINFSTIAVSLALEGESVYGASKAGVESFSRTLARELSNFGITVNCVAPGPIATELIRGVSPSKIQTIIERQIQRRQFTPADVCELVDLLISEKARGLTGQVFHLGGA